MNTQLHSQFFDYLNKTETTQRSAAKALGVSVAVLSLYKNDKAEKSGVNVADLERRLEQYLTREGARKSVLSMPTLELTHSNEIATVCETVHTTRNIGVICGAAGSGKTTALRQYQKKHACVYIVEVDPSMLLAGLVAEVARVLDIDNRGSVVTLSQRIRHKLTDIDALVIFDESDYLTSRVLEWIRRVIHDKAQCGVILAGLPKLEQELRSLKNTHDQLVSRVIWPHHVRKPTSQDLGKVVNAVWNDIDAPARKALTDAAQGCFRVLHNLMTIVWMIARKQGYITPTLEHVEEAAEMVLGACMHASLQRAVSASARGALA